MKIELVEITIPRMVELLGEVEKLETIVVAAKFAQPLCAAMYGEELLCVYALIPFSTLSDTAYIWMHHTPALEAHKIIFVRRSRYLTAQLLAKFSTLTGHCAVASERSRAWLVYVGAKFIEVEGNLIRFEISRG